MSVTDLPDYTGYSDIENVYGDVKIYTPSGLWVVGSDIITARAVSGTLAPGGGEEDVIFQTDPSVETRGRIRQVGLGLRSANLTDYADAVNDAVLRIYLDDDVDAGTPTLEVWVADMDLLNGYELYIRSYYELYDTTITMDSTTCEVYYAHHVSTRGGLLMGIYDRPDLKWIASCSWISLDCEWLEKVKITLYNDNPNSNLHLFGWGVVLYGLYP